MIKSEIQPKIIESLKSLLKDSQFVQIDNISLEQSFGKYTPDAVWDIKVNGETVKLVLEVKSQSEPRQLRSVIQQLKYYGITGGTIRTIENKVYGIIGAPYISNDSAQICKENDIGYIDLSGNCFLNFEKVYIERKNYPNNNIIKRRIKSIFTPKASRVLRVLLCNPKRYWQVQELSKEADVSLGETYKVKEKLLDLEYLKEENKKILLAKPEQLLTKWTENYSFRKNDIKNYFCLGELREIENKIAEYCNKKNINYAFALFSGAALIAPYARYTKVNVYIKENITELVNSLNLKQVESGPNIALMTPYDEGIFYATQKINGTNVVSNIQLYLDLIGYRGRGEESAKFLFEEKIKPQW